MTTTGAGTRPRGLLRSLSGSQRLLLALLALITVGLVAGLVGLTTTMLGQSRQLQDKLELTQDIVDGNVRTLTQVQREVLRLQRLLVDPETTDRELRLQQALVTQRAQEGTLSYQLQTLHSEELLEQSEALQARWTGELRPLLRSVLADGPDAAEARGALVTGLGELERDYNQLVSDGENNRKVNAGEANDETQAMLAGARRLVVGLLATFAALALLVVVVVVTFTTFHRQRDRASRSLLEANDELRKHAHVVAATDNMVVVTDAAGLVEWVNPAFETRTGFTLDEVVGRSPGSVLQRDDVDPRTVAHMRESLAAGRSFRAEVRNYTRDGLPYWIAMDVNPLVDDDGTVTGFVAVQRDITDRRSSEALLRQAKEAAEETARDKSTFLASMSHEIRTPLNAVLGLTDLLLLTDLDEDQREYVRTAHSSGRLLLALINDILDFSALESGRVEMEQRGFALASMVRDTVDMFATSSLRRGTDLTMRVEDDVPTHVVGDETRLRQVLVNLVGNALKFTERGQVGVDVSVLPAESSGSGEPQLRLVVRDTGIGIPEERLARLFHPFTQVDASTTRKYGGTGLGLAICRLIVEQMDGSISVESRAGEGSSFAVQVPLVPATAAEPEAPQTSGPTAALSDLRVLLAEDDQVNQTVARHMLRRLGLEPVVVADGQAAVDACLAERFDVVLMDVHMPGTDGVQATSQLRALLPEERRPWIVAVTANALDGDRERLIAAGMDSYLSKPVQIEALEAELSAVPDRRDRGESRLEAGAPSAPSAPPAQPTADPLDTGPAVVDFEAFVERTGLDDAQLHRALVRELADQVDAAVQVLAGADDAERSRSLHRLLGAAATAGAPAMHEAVLRAHDRARDGLEPDLPAVSREMARLESWLTSVALAR